MNESNIWWLITGLAVAIELATGTFYLLMVALGLAAGAVAAWIGVSLTWQMVSASLVGGGAVAVWHGIQSRRAPRERASANPDVNLDVGQTVQVSEWRTDRTAEVSYRGAQWTVTLAAQSVPSPGPHRIVEVLGSQLIVQPL